VVKKNTDKNMVSDPHPLHVDPDPLFEMYADADLNRWPDFFPKKQYFLLEKSK